MLSQQTERLEKPVRDFVRADFVLLREDMTVEEAVSAIRDRGVSDSIGYFYVADAEDRLTGVLPTRRLLSVPAGSPVSSIMIRRVVAIPDTATLLDACEVFVLHKFFAFPVVDKDRRVVGVIDIGLFTDEVLDIDEKERVDHLFETLGFHVSQVKGVSPARAFRFRFPWLLATIASGTACALLAGVFQATLEQSLVLAFFLTLVLGLGESVSIQSMTLALQSLKASRPTLRWFLISLGKELQTAILLGAACAVVVSAIVWTWRGDPLAAAAIGVSIVFSLSMACLLGLAVPAFLHATRLDPKIASGPITLALADLCTLFFYFSVATLIFRHA